MGASMKPQKLPDCPTCRVPQAVRLAHRTALDKSVSWLRLYPFRCDACGSHFYRFLKTAAG
jgi:hypothetical protein